MYILFLVCSDEKFVISDKEVSDLIDKLKFDGERSELEYNQNVCCLCVPAVTVLHFVGVLSNTSHA